MNNNISKNGLRYDRIDRVAGVTSEYKKAIISLEITDDRVNTYNGQVMAIVTANLIARWANGISFSLNEEIPCILKKYCGRSLLSVLKEIVLTAKPDCELRVNDNMPVDLSLSIGSSKTGSTWIDCDGWIAGYGYNTTNHSISESSQSLLGSSFAACLGVSEIFRQANGDVPVPFQKWFSLYNYESNSTKTELVNAPLPKEVFIGTVHQIGCGAIGSSFDFILSLSEEISGNIHLIDHDEVEEQNLAASLIFSPQDVVDKVKKVDACFKELKGSILATPFPDDYAAFIKANHYRNNPPDILLCFANERNIWATIQHKCPPITFHATTNKTWGTNFGRHIPEKDWCIMCRFHKEVKQISPLACSTGNISVTPNEEKLGILPFLASTSAIIAIAEIYKLNITGIYPATPNFVEFSMRKPQGQFMPLSRPSKDCEICKQQSLDIYPSYIKDSKYWHLSK